MRRFDWSCLYTPFILLGLAAILALCVCLPARCAPPCDCPGGVCPADITPRLPPSTFVNGETLDVVATVEVVPKFTPYAEAYRRFQAGEPMAVYVTGPNCTYCRQMEREVLPAVTAEPGMVYTQIDVGQTPYTAYQTTGDAAGQLVTPQLVVFSRVDGQPVRNVLRGFHPLQRVRDWIHGLCPRPPPGPAPQPIPGPLGPQGPPGKDSTVPGPMGPIGPPGKSPTVAMSGDQVTVNGAVVGPHLTGPAGKDGAPGKDSTVAGPAGKDGTNGTPGKDSTVAGPAGKQGPAGKDAVVDPVAIAAALPPIRLQFQLANAAGVIVSKTDVISIALGKGVLITISEPTASAPASIKATAAK